MTNRRKFLQQSGTLAMASLLYPGLSRSNPLLGIKAPKDTGLQLYTVGGLMETDPKGTLQKLAAIGYKELESAGSAKGIYYGYKPKEFSALVKDLGMKWRSEHVSGIPFTMNSVLKMAKTAKDSADIQKLAPMIEAMAKMPNLRDNTQQLADEAAEGGLTYVVCAGMPVDTMDDIKAAVDVMNKAGEICKKSGLQFAYHNHHLEFIPVGGVTPFDYMMANTDKNLVQAELDLGWAIVAGKDPIDVFNKYPGRIPLWHVKDIDKTTKAPTELGSGMVDFKRIFDNAGTSGMKYFFIEQDNPPHPLENATNDFNNLKKKLA